MIPGLVATGKVSHTKARVLFTWELEKIPTSSVLTSSDVEPIEVSEC